MKNISAMIFLFISAVGLCQDTIIVEESIHFRSAERKKYFMKGFNAEYGCEEIIFSEFHKRVEYCYYEDNQRNCRGLDYYILNDSTLMISDSSSIWNYRKVSDNKYFFYQKTPFFLISGFAESLMPLKLSTPLFCMKMSNGDTIYTITFNHSEKYFPEGKMRITPYFSAFNGPLFEYYEIDTDPKLQNGNSIPIIEIDNIQYCYCSPYLQNITLISVVVTSDGRIINIDQAIGNIELEYCSPKTYIEIADKISQLGNVNPAFKNGQAVNVRWFIAIDLKNSDPIIKTHPAYADTKENRLLYIKRMNKKK